MSAALVCFAGCAGVRFGLTEPVYRCPKCLGLLDVAHDEEALAERSATDWKRLFAERAHAAWPLCSGVWAKREWVAPELPDDCIVSLGEGRSPLVPAPELGRQIGAPHLWIKQCGQSPTGSFKDLGMTVLVSVVRQAVREGRKIRALGCASTGDTSAALAAYGAAAGLPVVVLLPRGKVSTAQLVQPLAAGARVLSLDGDFDACMAVMQPLAADGTLYLANSMNALRLEGQKTAAIEICEQLGWRAPDWLALPAGNLGNGYAMFRGLSLARRLGLIDRLPRLVLAQAERANPLYRAFVAGKSEIDAIAAGPTLATAIRIGNPVSAARAIKALRQTGGAVEQATEQELCDAGARADRAGIYCDPHTAVALVAVEKLARAGTISRDERVVVVSTASGLKFTEDKVRYHERSLGGIDCRLANAPIELPADVDAVREAIAAG